MVHIYILYITLKIFILKIFDQNKEITNKYILKATQQAFNYLAFYFSIHTFGMYEKKQRMDFVYTMKVRILTTKLMFTLEPTHIYVLLLTKCFSRELYE